MFDTVEVVESLGTGITSALTGSKYRIRLIEADKLGSSGYYPAEMLRRCGPTVFKAGTQMFFDHVTAEEKAGPLQHGRVHNMAAKLATDAWFENDGLYADIEVYEHQRPIVKALMDDLGVSIRATGLTKNQNINGKSVPVFHELLEAKSVDFVVKAGAGGKIVSILESAQEVEESESMELTKENIAEITAAVIAGLPVASVESAQVEPEKVVDYDQVVELAEALSNSSLDAEGRSRVLDLHRANGKDIAGLIAAEEAYRAALVPEVKDDKTDSVESAGREETVTVDAEESATTERRLPGRWTKGN